MPKPARSPHLSVKEPVQVYLAGDDRHLLARLVEETGLSKAEILRRGVRSFAREHGVASPMLRFVAESDPTGWERNVAKAHDEIIAATHRTSAKKKRR